MQCVRKTVVKILKIYLETPFWEWTSVEARNDGLK